MSTHAEPTTGWEAQERAAPAADERHWDEPAGSQGVEEPDGPLVVPDEVETTVPIGTPDQPGSQPEPEPDEKAQRRGAPVVAAEPHLEPPASATAPGTDAWRDLQARFVDDPQGAVAEAGRLVREAVEDQAGSSGSADTEQLRQAFTRLRDVHARLTG